MNKWNCLIVLLLLTACSNNNDEKAPGELTKNEMPDNVRTLYKQAEQHPDSVGLRLRLVDALDSLGAFNQANSEMDSLLRKDSLNYGLWYRKALLQQNSRDTIGALRSYRYAIRIYPSPDAILAAANLLAEKKDSTALMLTRQIREQRLGGEYEAHTYFIAGIYFARTGNPQKATELFNACIHIDYHYMEAYMEKGFLLFEAKKTAEAAQVFRTVVTIKNTYADGYYWLAKCEEALHRPTEAVANYQRALVLDPGIREAKEGLKRLGR
jgi:tetratricopeptide (TPR) repeat protein